MDCGVFFCVVIVLATADVAVGMATRAADIPQYPSVKVVILSTTVDRIEVFHVRPAHRAPSPGIRSTVRRTNRNFLLLKPLSKR